YRATLKVSRAKYLPSVRLAVATLQREQSIPVTGQGKNTSYASTAGSTADLPFMPCCFVKEFVLMESLTSFQVKVTLQKLNFRENQNTGILIFSNMSIFQVQTIVR